MKKIVSVFLTISIIFAAFCISPVSLAEAKEDNGLCAKPAGQIKYVRSSGLVSGVSPKSEVAEVLSSFDPGDGDIYLTDKSGFEKTSGYVATGDSVVYKSTTKKETAQVIIYGDVTGDGVIASSDILSVKRYILKGLPVSEISMQAANVSGEGDEINSADLLSLKRNVLGLGNIRNSSFYYVSKSGSNSGDGSENKPFLTVQKAADVMKAGDTCFIDSGIYRETVTPKYEGEKGAPITFKAKESADVTVSGTDVATTSWTQYKDGIYKTNLTLYRGSENQIFVNGEMAQIARYPNKNSDNFIAVGETFAASSASDSFVQSDSLSFSPDLSGAEIAVEGSNHYLYYSSKVTSKSGNRVDFEKVNSGWDSPTSQSRFYFYNKLNLLDEENEYFYDNGVLYYKPASGVDMNNALVEYSARSVAFNTNDRSYITVSGITIYGATVQTNEGSDHLNLDGNRILYYYHTTKARNYPWQNWFFGVMIYGDDSIVQNNEIAYGAEGGVEVHGDRVSVVNNYLHDINYINSNAAAIENFTCDYTLISHNTIRNLGRSAIILNSANMRVCYNDISECAVNTYDVTGIGSYKFDAMGTVEVDHNIIHNSNNNHMFTAYYFDNGSFNYLIHHNLCYDVDGAMTLNNPSYGNKIYNNTFIGDKPIGTGNLQNPYQDNKFIGAVWHGDQFYNNILPSVFYGDGALFSNNLLNKAKELNFANPGQNDYSLKAGSAAIDKGYILPVGCEKYQGSAPDIGAFEYGEEKWTAGHDFSKSFDIEYSLSEKKTGFTPVYGDMYIEPEFGQNLLKNPDFSSGTENWNTSKTTVTDGVAIIKDDWIEQTLQVSPGQIYKYCGDVKCYDADNSFVEFGVHFLNGDTIINQGAFMVTSSADERRSTLISVPEGCNKMRIFVASWGTKQYCSVDNLGLYLAQ